MVVDIQIDKLTDCLVERESGDVVDTEYAESITVIKKKDCVGWNFNWSTTQKNGYTVYELFVEDDDTLEAGCDGFVAFTAKSDLVEYYKRTLNAQVVRGNRMYLDEEAANILIDKYIRK